MIRIVGIQRSESPNEEFILLQNQGGLRVNLKGHLILSESALTEGDLATFAHAFNDEALIPPSMYVILYTGSGEARWARSKDGALVYYVYMHRDRSVWQHCAGPLHVLSTHHTYVERREPAMLR